MHSHEHLDERSLCAVYLPLSAGRRVASNHLHHYGERHYGERHGNLFGLGYRLHHRNHRNLRRLIGFRDGNLDCHRGYGVLIHRVGRLMLRYRRMLSLERGHRDGYIQ